MKYLLSLVLFVGILACQAKWDQNLLPGNWKTLEWVEVKTGTPFDNKMDFEFNANGRYQVDYGSSVREDGAYWITGDFLHTIEDGQAEKKVKILQLSADSLLLEMNRSGRIEQVKLVKLK